MNLIVLDVFGYFGHFWTKYHHDTLKRDNPSPETPHPPLSWRYTEPLLTFSFQMCINKRLLDRPILDGGHAFHHNIMSFQQHALGSLFILLSCYLWNPCDGWITTPSIIYLQKSDHILDHMQHIYI